MYPRLPAATPLRRPDGRHATREWTYSTRTSYVISIGADQHVVVGNKLKHLRQNRLYRFIPNTGKLKKFWNPTSLGIPNLDAADIMTDGRIMFSTSTNPFITYDGGTMRLWESNLYFYHPDSGTIERMFHGSARGLNSLDAASLGSSAGEYPDE